MFDFKYRKIEKKQMNLPPGILAFKLLRKAKITREEHSIILTEINFKNRATLYDDAKKALKKFKRSCRGIHGCSLGTGLASDFPRKNEVLCVVGNIRVEEVRVNMHMQATAVHGIGGILGTHIMD